MTTRIEVLTEGQVERLRSAHPFFSDTTPILRLARERGWEEANIGHLQNERRRGVDAMRDLMREVGIDRVTSVAEAMELLVLAFRVFAPEPGGLSVTVVRESQNRVRIAVSPCPVYRELERRGWRGVSACPSWHRRRGWLDALGVFATDSVESEMRWGDNECATVIEVQAVPGPEPRPAR